MQSFRTILEAPGTSNKAIVEQDIIELGEKIAAFKDGSLHEDKFRALRLARGVYGQRQQGVQMIRIKLPFGKVTANQLRRIATVSDEYSTGHLHITTRQDIQIHYVSLDRTPQLWADLEKDDVTLREACGNTVRNVTASAIAGIDPKEPFDVSPYADLVFRYFLRKPFGQELGRKIKIAFSSSEEDDAFTFIHDFGFIPKVETINGELVDGFKVVVGGGLGAQPILAHVAYEFLPATEILPFIEASIRIFERYGERNSRNKARMKYLIAKIGFERFLELVKEEIAAVQYRLEEDFVLYKQQIEYPELTSSNTKAEIVEKAEGHYKDWLQTNVFEQKQKGYFGVFVKVRLGNFNTEQARALASILDEFQSNEIRFTIDQSFLLKFIREDQLQELYTALSSIGFTDTGYNSILDVTACPGTDTCNLAISNSTDVSEVIEATLRDEYPSAPFNTEIKIKISGCMNSCGQHGLAHIGFHGSSIKVDKATAPALQVLIGGGKLGNGHGRVAEKVIKVPSKRILDVLRYILNDYYKHQENDEAFLAYYDRVGNKYFYDLLKPLADTSTLKPEDFVDWGQEEAFKTAIGVGECAGVMLDLVATLLNDAEDKIKKIDVAISDNRPADALFFGYAAAIHAAKAVLLDKKITCNTQQGIIVDFDKNLGAEFGFTTENTFEQFVLSYRNLEQNLENAQAFTTQIKGFVQQVVDFRQATLNN